MGAIFEAVSGAVAGGAGSILNYVNQRKALQQQQEAYDYQQELNNLMMEREDSAYQRTVADMEKAGLNPLSMSSVNSASSMSAGSAPSTVPQLDLEPAINAYFTARGQEQQGKIAALNNATNESIAQMQQRGVDMANAYNYEVGMANAFANQLKAITDYKRSGVNDPEVLKALKAQIIADAKNATHEANIKAQEESGRSASGNYRGMPTTIASIREGEVYAKEKADNITDLVNDVTDDSTGLGKVKHGENFFTKILSAMSSFNRGARKQASRQLLRGVRRRR